MKTRTVFLLLLAALVLPTVLTVPAATAQSGGYTLVTITPTVRAGERADFEGSGFLKDERVASWATTPDQQVIGGAFAKATGKEGRISIGFDVPKDALGGRWSFTVYGELSQTSVVATFEVIARTPNQKKPAVSIAPPSGGPNTRFKVFASGFRDLERISYWVTAPDGSIDAHPEDNDATEDGDVYFDWTAPLTIAPGTHTITIQGVKSGVVRGITVEIRR